MAIDIRKIQSVDRNRTKDAPVRKKYSLPDILTRDIQLIHKGLSNRKKESFYAELGILLSSGIDIRTSLEIIVEEQKNDVHKKLFAAIYQQVVSGKSISEALYQTGKFSLYEYYSLKIGEESSRIREVLADLTLYFSKKIRQRRQLANALTYPSLVLLTALLAVFFMLKFIVPMFTEVFRRFQGDLPPLTRTIIAMSDSFSRYAGIFIALILLISFLAWFFRKKDWYRKYTSRLLLRLPLMGMVINKIYLARFCQSMALLLGSKTPMLKTLQLVRNMIGFWPFEQALSTIENDVLHGRLLNQSMHQFPVFDKRTLALTRVAEEVNRLDKVYDNLNAQYTEELEHQLGIIGNILEPVMIVMIGFLVAIVLISMYLPLFQLSTSIM